MPIAFVDKPIKGRCHVQVPGHFDSHFSQCSRSDKHAMTDGFKRVEVCNVHRNQLLRRNEIWKTQWKELALEEVEQEPPTLPLRGASSIVDERDKPVTVTTITEPKQEPLGPHPLNKHASDQATPDELATMQDIFDRTISSPGVTQKDLTKILRWVGEQGEIKRAKETMDEHEFTEYLKKLQEEDHANHH